MTQHKAASLTSNLFARKGRASPASLLIAELEGVAPDVATEIATGAEDRAPRPNGKRKGARKPDLNGSAGPKKAKAPAEEELPLLAFVEGQAAGSQAEGAQADGAEVAGEKAAPPTQPSPDPSEEPRPPASLLDGGARALRSASGRAPAGEAVSPTVAEAAEDDAPSGPADAGEDFEAETVSGDENVAAIEDAPESPETESPETESAPPEPAEAEAIAPKAAEPQAEPEAAEIVAAPAPVEETADAAADDAGAAKSGGGDSDGGASAPRAAAREIGADATVSATVALRRAAAARAAPAASPRAAMPAVAAAPPKPAGGVLPWRSAVAVVAAGVVLGLGAYVGLSGDTAAPQPESPQPAAETALPPVPEDSGETAAASETASDATAPDTAAPDTAAPDSAAPDTAAPAAQPPEPSFDVIRIEPDGQSIIAGRAAPGSEWILLNNGSPIASVQADVNGEWVVLPDASLVPGANAFSLVPKTERGKVAIPAPAEKETLSEPSAPGPQSDSGADAAPAAAAENGPAIALPRPKPAAPPPGLAPRARLAEGGDYQLQVASVRRSADAERERNRLSAAYPELLGGLGLRVQEASVEGAGTFFRVRSGAIADLGAARAVCRRLEAAGQGCLVVRRPPDAGAPQTEVVQEQTTAQDLPPEQQAQRPQ